jgi:arylformamidase
MQTYDISLTISQDLPVWPGDPQIKLERIQKIEDGDAANVTKMTMSVHVGTHVDAPYHFLGEQNITIEKLSLKLLNGRAYVLHVPDEIDQIDADYLKNAQIPPRTRRILFKTRNSKLWANETKKFQKDFVAINKDGAQYLADRNVKLIGVDYLSVAPFTDSISPHKILLKANIIIVEGLNLSQVSQGRYTLHCLPLKIAGADGAPARAILVGV